MRKVAGIAPNTLTKMKKDDNVSLRVLEKYAELLIVILKIWSSI